MTGAVDVVGLIIVADVLICVERFVRGRSHISRT